MSRDVEYDPEAICDICGATGAFDFMGDCYCPKCTEWGLKKEVDS